MTDTNVRLAGEQLVSEVERRSLRLAEACLREPDLAAVVAAMPGDERPGTLREIGLALDRVRARHPIARQFFILDGETIRFPLLRVSRLDSLEATLARENPGGSSTAPALLAQAENEELRQDRCDLALDTYRRADALALSDSFRALVMARSARCFVKLHRPNAAEELYRQIGDRYGDVYDPFHQPYALVAGLELHQLGAADSADRLGRLYGEIARGRWELSAEQVDYFLDTFQRRLNLPAPMPSEYLRRTELARALAAGFRHQGPLRAGDVYAYGFQRGDTNYQTFYTRLSGDTGRDTIVGLAVDLDWVAQQLLPAATRELGLGTLRAVAVNRSAFSASPPRTRVAQVNFSSTFSFWGLSVAPAAVALTAYGTWRSTFVFAGSTALILTALVVGVVLLIRDVARDQQLNRLRADLVSGVSHELKTPLTLIKLYVETLSEDRQVSDGERRSYYQIITRESERLAHLIEKVLDFSRLERGRTTYDLTDGDIGPIVARTVEIYGQHLRRRGFTIAATLESAMPLVRFDAEAVAGAVLNLLENAAKYSGDARSIDVRLFADQEHVMVDVTDHGIGIPATEHEAVFDQFYRSRQRGGTGGYGLGLYLVKHIMEEHGGRVELESEPGRGSRFRLVFPLGVTMTESPASFGSVRLQPDQRGHGVKRT